MEDTSSTIERYKAALRLSTVAKIWTLMLQNNVTLEDLAEYSEKADKNKHPLNRVREHKSGKPTVPKRGEQIRGEVSEPKQTRRNAYKAPSRPETTNTTEET